MLQLKNDTVFQVAMAAFPNAQAIDTAYAVITATFELFPHVRLGEEQLSPVLADRYWDEDNPSSLRFASELHLGKPSTDVIVVGHARTLDERPAPELIAGVQVAERRKVARVFGDRVWTGERLSHPVPFTQLPLVYERAFGGVVALQDKPPAVEERNPLGKGLPFALRCPVRGDELPNIEDPHQLLTEGSWPRPMGFGCIAPAWLPRRSFAGTYDDAWQHTRAPFLPDDFMPSFFSCASEGLVFDRYLAGGEPVTLVGMSPYGSLFTTIPRVQLATTFVLRGQRHQQPNHLQTVLLEPDENRMRLTFHTELPCDKALLEVEALELSLRALDLTPSSEP